MLTGYMPNPNGFPNFQVPQYRGRMTLPPRGPSTSKSPSPQPLYYGPIHPNMPRSCSSDILSEEPPAWLEDLLNEPETTVVNKTQHQRSASDSSTGVPTCNFQIPLHFFNGMPRGTLINRKPDFQQQQDKLRISVSNSPKLPNGLINAKEDADCQALGMTCSPEPHRVRVPKTGTENQGLDASFMSDNLCKPNDSASNTDAKRKQHNAQRSRARKLQYIAQLETNAKVLQAARAEVSAQLEFFDQQNLMLGMENRALKQRLQSLSKEHYIKSMEQEMLDKELGRLQYLYQVQRNMNHNQHHQQQQQHKHKQNHRRGRSVNDLATLNLTHPPPPRPLATSNGPLQ